MTNFKKFASIALTLLVVVFTKPVSASDINISSASNVPRSFNSNNQLLQIGSGGSIALDSNSPLSAGISSSSFTNIAIELNAGALGIDTSVNNRGAIEISSGSLNRLTIDGGAIISNGTNGTVFLTQNVATTSILTASGTTIENRQSLGNAIFSNSNNDLTLNISNAGTIKANNSSNSSAINITDSNGGSLVILNNTGTIDAGASGNALYLSNSGNTATVYNSGAGQIIGAFKIDQNSASITNNSSHANSILGSITATTGYLNIANNSGSIIGNISLGSNSNSTLAINGGSIVGNVTLGNTNQTLTLDGGSLSGTINGSGKVVASAPETTLGGAIGNSAQITSLTLGADSNLNTASNNVNAATIILNSNSTLNVGSGSISSVGNIRGGAIGVGTLNLNNNQTINGTIGATFGLATVHVGDGATIAANNSINSTNLTIGDGASGTLTLAAEKTITAAVAIANGATLNLNNNSIVYGAIKGVSVNTGRVNFNDDSTLAGNLGSDTLSLNTVSIAFFKILEAGSYDIKANTITLNNLAMLNTSKDVVGAVGLDLAATLNLADGARAFGSINGVIDHLGTINTEGSVEIFSSIGNTHSIDEMIIASDSRTRISNSDNSGTNIIKADHIFIAGQLDLLDATTIIGNVELMDAGATINSSGHSQIINGNFTTASESQIILDVHNAISADKITVSGAANLNANTKLYVSFANGGTTAVGSSYVIVAGGAGSNINKVSDNNITVDGNGSNRIGRYILGTSVSGNNLLLNVFAAASPTTNSNQNKIYDVIASANAGSGGELYVLQQYINGSASDSAKSVALDSALPAVDNSNNRLIFNSANTSFDLSSSRLQSLYNSGGASGISSGDGVIDHKKTVWMQAFGSSASQGNTTISEGYSANLRGFAFGADHEIADDLFAGLSASYSNSNVKSRSALKKTTIDSYQINAYSGYHFDKYFINGLAGFVWNEYKSNRAIAIVGSNARANYSGQAYVARAEFGLNEKLAAGFILTPTAIITAAHNSISDYSENGAGTLNLSVRNNASNFFEGRGGITLSNSFNLKDTVIQPEISTSYGYDFAGSKQRTSSNFVGQTTTFDATASNIARGSLKIGAGAKIYSNDTLSFHLNYVFEHRTNYQANSAVFKMGYKF